MVVNVPKNQFKRFNKKHSFKLFQIIVLFIARGMSSAFFQAVYVYTPEVYPTDLRAVALGSGSGAARIGAMITPYIAQVLLKRSLYAAVSVYAGIGEARYTVGNPFILIVIS